MTAAEPLVGDGADVELVSPGDEPALPVGAVGVGPGAEGDAGGGLADGVLEVGGGDAGRRGDDRVGVFAVGPVEAEQGVEVDRAACLVLGGLAVGQAQGLLVFRERGKVDLAGCVTVPGEADQVAFDVLLGAAPQFPGGGVPHDVRGVVVAVGAQRFAEARDLLR